MPIQCVCPGCGKILGVPDHALGMQVRCQACQLVFTAEAPADSATPPMELEPAPAAPIAETPLKPARPSEASADPPPILQEPGPIIRRPAMVRARSSTPIVLIIVLGVLGVGGVLVLTCVGGVAWWLIPAREGKVAMKKVEAKDFVRPVEVPKDAPAPDRPPPDEGKNLPKVKFPEEKRPPFFEKKVEEKFPKFVPGDPRFDGPPRKNDAPPQPIAPKTGKLAPLPAPLPIKPPTLTANVVTKQLADTIQSVVLGGGGRFLIMHLPKPRQLAIFDANEAKVKYLPLGADNALIAAGMTKLIVAFPDTKIMQRWNLLTFERELSVPLPLNERLAGIGMGYGSDGPLLMQTMREPFIGDTLFLDIRTMKLIDLAVKARGGVIRGPVVHMRGSADGRVFSVTGGMQPGCVVAIEPRGALLRNQFGVMPGVPGPDGKHFFGFGLFNADLKPIGAQGNNPFNQTACVPAVTGPFYLAIPAGQFHPNVQGGPKPAGVELRIIGDNRPILTLPDVENAMRDVFAPNRDTLPIDQRYHFIPDAKLLVTVPSSLDMLKWRRLDLDEALEKAGIDYLFVTSTAPAYAVLGQEFTYPVEVKSKKGGLKYRIEAGPDGMKVAANGAVSWKVAADRGEGPADVIMTITDSAGQEIFHTFRLDVVRELPPEAIRSEAKRPAPVPVKKAPAPEPVVKVPPPPAPDALTIRAPKLDKSPLPLDLPGPVDQVVVGGGGRFLLLKLPGQRKIALFDANAAKVVHSFPVAGENVKYAASVDKLVMVFPDTRVVQRWNLLTREREVTTTLEGDGTVANVVMGSATRGPLLVGLAGQFGRGGQLVIDLATLRARDLPQQPGVFGQRGMGDYACIAADGSVVTTWGANMAGMQVFHITPTGLKGYYQNANAGHLVPSADGRFIYTSRGLYTNEAKPLGANAIGRNASGAWCIPAVAGDYYLSVDMGKVTGKAASKAAPRGALAVHRQGEERTLVTLPEVALPREIDLWGREKFGDHQRIAFIPDAKMIVTVPETNDKLVIYRFDVEDAMDKAGIDYLYATSRPPAQAVRGMEYVYQITARSKKGGVTYRLESGPDGMQMTKAGVIVWTVPADQPLGQATVIVTIADRSGQEVFHTFRVTVAEARDPGKK